MTSQFSAGQKQTRIVVKDEPLRGSFGRTNKDEFSIIPGPAEMFDVCTCERIAAHDPVTGPPWPATLNCQGADASSQSQLNSNHGRGTTHKAMIFVALNLDGGALTIRFSSQGKEGVEQPIRGRAPQEVVASPQVEISRNVSAPFALRALGCLGERDFPRFIEFSHLGSSGFRVISSNGN
jgi:hypothetical protein